MWIEVFRSGKQTDSRGHEAEYSASQLESIAELYNSKVAEDESFMAPVVKGHPSTDAPALGWVERLARRGEFLLAKLKGVDPELAEDVNDGHFASVSISLYPDNMLRHVGFLGAAAPAVRGLRRPNLRPGSEYAEYEHQPAPPHQSSFAAESSSTALPTAVTAAAASGEDLIDENQIEPQAPKQERRSLLTTQISELSRRVAESNEKICQLEGENRAKRQKIQDLEQTIQSMEAEARKNEFHSFAASIKSENCEQRYTPAQIEDICTILELLHSRDSAAMGTDFSEQESGGTDIMKRFLSSPQVRLPIGEFAAPPQSEISREIPIGNTGDARWAVHKRAMELVQANAAASYVEAAEIAFRELY